MATERATKKEKEKAKAGEVNFYFKIRMLQGKSPAAFFCCMYRLMKMINLIGLLKVHFKFIIVSLCFYFVNQLLNLCEATLATLRSTLNLC